MMLGSMVVDPRTQGVPNLTSTDHRKRDDFPKPEVPQPIEKTRKTKKEKQIDGQPYPKLTADGKFIPMRRIVHLDLKGGAYKPSFFPAIFEFFSRMGITGILLEWEDMFPYTGKVSAAVNGYAYTMDEVEEILKQAKSRNLDVIPLVQTIGHLEWVLKLEQFAHLREDPRFPQVICIGSAEAWDIVRDMVDQVAKVHQKYGMNFFHMGADEVFNWGTCNYTVAEVQRQNTKDRVLLWHISRTASYVKNTYQVTVLAWHDMFAGRVMEDDLHAYDLTNVLEPVLWSYAEDLEQYLPFQTWMALKPFKRVWGSSAFKGADGPMRFNSNPIHYIRNHESWVTQMSRVYNEFDYFQGLVFTGWSRYDHLAVLAELFPIGVPSLAMSVETIVEGRPLNGRYPKTTEWLHCSPQPEMGFTYGCNFPGSKIYELVNEYYQQRQQLRKYIATDFEFNGWLANYAERYTYSSPMYIDKILPFVDVYLQPLERIEADLRTAMAPIYFEETIDEFILTYMSEDLELLRHRKKVGEKILVRRTFEKRPFVKYPAKKHGEL
ncbi:hexosaminidase [Aphelenchoides avenae]|nr:hexosaminidase [Aphelenchus avenae]